MNHTPIMFHLTWLTSRPLLRGNRRAIALGMIPAALAILALVSSIPAADAHQGPILLSAGLFLSLSATMIQLPSFAGRVAVGADALTVITPLMGRGARPAVARDWIQQAFYAPLKRPPNWTPFAWGGAELLMLVGAAAAGWRGSTGYWIWAAAFAVGLSFWPLMAARWRAEMQVVLIYQRPGATQPNVILAWATPHEAASLINTLQGKIDWEPPQPPS